MRENQSTLIKGKKVVLVPYRKCHVLKYHEWMKSEELQKLTASEPLSLEEEYEMQQTWLKDEDKCTFIVLDAAVFETSGNEIEAMVGDVNLFFTEEEGRNAGEVEIMIAEPDARGKGMGKEAALLMMRYGVDDLGVSKYSVKIGYENNKSISMFSKFGFKEVSRSDVFQEVTMELPLDHLTKDWLNTETTDFSITPNYEFS